MKLMKMTFVAVEYVNVIAHVFKGNRRLPFPSNQHADRAVLSAQVHCCFVGDASRRHFGHTASLVLPFCGVLGMGQ